jgi:hypothetical protein
VAEKCATCGHPIRPGEGRDKFRSAPFHSDPADCLAARTRRCYEILQQMLRAASLAGETAPYAELAHNKIVREFPEAFKEGRSE